MTNNKLKIIALITMIIDHFGFYFADFIPNDMYWTLRIIGRISMPIFSFLIVQGAIHTKNIDKYITRVFLLACLTQISFVILDIIFKENRLALGSVANIIFSYVIFLVLIKLLEQIKLKNNIITKLIFTIFTLITIIIYNILSFDYGIRILIMCISMYIVMKYIDNNIFKKILLSVILVVVSIVSVYLYGIINIFAILSIVPIVLYNGKLGKKSKIIKYSVYCIFPIHHILLYCISCLI